MKEFKHAPIEIQAERNTFWQENKKQEIIKYFSPRVAKVISEVYSPSMEYPIPSCYMYGKTRTGKTIAVYIRLLEWCRIQYINRGMMNYKVTSVLHLLESLRNNYNNPEIKELIVSDAKNARLLVLDDFGAEKITEWAFMMLYDIIDHRYNNLLTTFYTSNLSLNELSAQLQDDRIPSRIAQDCGENIFEFTNKPYI